MNWYKMAKIDRQAGLTETIKRWIATGFSAAAIIAALQAQGLSAAEIESINVSSLIEEIKRHEGVKNVSYDDTEGVRTVGVGYNLETPNARNKIDEMGLSYDDIFTGTHSLSDDQINELLGEGMAVAIKDARKFVGINVFHRLPREAKHILVNMSFNLGGPRLSKFKNFREALIVGDYQKAADEMIDSKWYKQVGRRSKELVQRMRAIK